MRRQEYEMELLRRNRIIEQEQLKAKREMEERRM